LEDKAAVECFVGKDQAAVVGFSGTSLIRNNPPVRPYNRPIPRDLW